ncbi:MAG: chlorite dismutase family protein [Dehalococcoidia bacterium]
MTGAERPQAADGQAMRRQFVKFTMFKVDPAWRRLSPAEREVARNELCAAVDAFGDRMLIGSYSLVGLRGDADFLLWQIADRLEDFQSLATAVFSTAMGPHLSVAYSYLSMTRRSIYKTPEMSERAESRLRVSPGSAKYLFVYPFVKTRPWYELSKDARQEMMNEHITVGRKYPSVKLNTTYSYGLDDQEFVVSFETDSPEDFLDLVMELRETKSSMYTLRDTPTFTCVAMPLPDALSSLGAPGDVAVAGEPATRAGAPVGSAGDGWTRVAAMSELPEGGASVVYFQGEQVALFNVGGRVYAIGNRCSHANGSLAEGKLDGAAVTCPLHDSQFDLATGEPLRTPAQRALPTYDVKLDDGKVFLAPARAAARQGTATTAD